MSKMNSSAIANLKPLLLGTMATLVAGFTLLNYHENYKA